MCFWLKQKMSVINSKADKQWRSVASESQVQWVPFYYGHSIIYKSKAYCLSEEAFSNHRYQRAACKQKDPAITGYHLLSFSSPFGPTSKKSRIKFFGLLPIFVNYLFSFFVFGGGGLAICCLPT